MVKAIKKTKKNPAKKTAVNNNAKGTADLIFEIGSEELPASYQHIALRQLKDYFTKEFEKSGLRYKHMSLYNTPRRLSVLIEKLSDREDDINEEVKGPNVKAAYDEEGNPTKALMGFVNSKGLKLGDLKKVSTDKGEYVYAEKNIKGRQTKKILPEMLEGAVKVLNFPKSMTWGDYDIKFARPLKWLTALYGKDIVKFSFGHIKSSNLTYGHRFEKPGALNPIKVDSIKSYMEKLKKAKVIVDMAARKEIIEKAIEKEASGVRGKVLPDFDLVEEVANLNEYPIPIMGSFDNHFLDLPRDVVVNAMRDHQRYFSVVTSKGKLLPYFITFCNTPVQSKKVVQGGNERVLRPRLSDAEFYYEKDKKTDAFHRLSLLRGVVFQKKLGTSYEKVQRFTDLALFIGERLGLSDGKTEGETVDNYLAEEFNPVTHSEKDGKYVKKLIIARASALAKTDLVSGVVGEFPNLQGVMGREYALLAGESQEVADAIREHYMPVQSGGDLPETEVGSIISIADKLETIAGCFSVGLVPTGAQDPYALRRQALGILAIIISKGLKLNIDELVGKALEPLASKIEGSDENKSEAVKENILGFIKDRLKNHLLAQKYPHDGIDAVLATDWFDIDDAVKRVEAITKFKDNPASEPMAAAFKRISNILKDKKYDDAEVNEELFESDFERKLFATGNYISPIIKEEAEKGDYEAAFKALATLKEDTDKFFDNVMVMAEDEKVKDNRLRLLYGLRELFSSIADISKLVG